MKTQYITDDKGNKLAVILPIKEYNKMLEELEELEDIKMYDVAKSKSLDFVDAELAFIEIEKERKSKPGV